MSNPVTLVVWKVGSEERPRGSLEHMERRVLAPHPDTGVVVTRRAWAVHNRDPWWAELPRLPADDPLTLEDLQAVCRVAEYAARRWGANEPDQLAALSVIVARIREVLRGEDSDDEDAR